VRTGLRVGFEVDRALASSLARELRRAEAIGAATRALRARPLSEQRLRERLRSRGVPAEAQRSALAALADAGFVDDARLAHGRAVALAERGWGDAAISARLEGEELPAAEIETAIAALEPEHVRAARLTRDLTDRKKAWALLARRGFDGDTIEATLGALDEDDSDGLG
jgi:regulatory protein